MENYYLVQIHYSYIINGIYLGFPNASKKISIFQKKHPKWMKLGGLTKSTIQKSLLKQFQAFGANQWSNGQKNECVGSGYSEQKNEHFFIPIVDINYFVLFPIDKNIRTMFVCLENAFQICKQTPFGKIYLKIIKLPSTSLWCSRVSVWFIFR